MNSMLSVVPIVTFIVVIIIVPAISIGALILLSYHAFTKVRPPIGRFAPVAVALGLSVLVPIVSRFSLLVDSVVIAMGVLTPFMAADTYLPDRYRYTILFLGSVVAVSGRLIWGFAGAFGGGAGSPIFLLLTAISSSDAGLLILGSIALYLEMVLISALIFGAIFVIAAASRKYAAD